ncbi:MAG: hypothetical protein J7623_19425 [Chitinophaga sp.]|uniref:HYC_CC_PP family protein n=1 Tax=Chitinophaga sp. TaxID=1869181 RepID=UPI001B2B56F7|nr:hypothetical protein [Chitinophaga sp.]MBO9730820.1 hypothetical protein [Chitinophaga sp.]
MKRFFAILFAVLYTTLTSGFTINVHYCMGKLAGIDLQETEAHECRICKMPAKGMDCCKDESKFCKVTESHQAAKALQQNFSLNIALELPVKTLAAPILAESNIPAGNYHHDPPDLHKTPIFIRNCTFLI